MTFTAHKPKAPTFCELGKHVDLICSTGIHREQITANIAGNSLVMLDHGFVKGKGGRGCCGGETEVS